MASGNSTYTYEGLTGWKRFRPLRPFRGMYHDIKRRLPYYRSDITDAFTYRTVASTVHMYCANILPAIAFTLDMYRRTGQFFGINEALFSSAMAALIFSVFGAQPLNIVGITGLISLFNYTIFNIVTRYEPVIYANFMCWTAIWAAIFHWIVAVCNLCDYMRYVTDFSSESFGMYIGIVYLSKGVGELVHEFSKVGLAAGFMSCMIAILYFLTVYALELLATSTVFRPTIRALLTDYAYVFATMFWVGFSHIPGNLKAADISRVPISRAFYPTQPRGWLIHFWELDVKWVFAAMPFGSLVMLLFYYDHNISSLTAQARRFPLKKPTGFHWDFFLLGITTFLAGITGVPMPNGQVPVHTNSLVNFRTELDIVSMAEGEREGEREGAEIRRHIMKPVSVVEQRVSHFFMGLGIIGTMTGPLLIVLHTMPAAVFAGVFFTVGWGSIGGNGILKKSVFLLLDHRFVARHEPLLKVRQRKIILWIACQLFGVTASLAISFTIAAIGFPVVIIALVPWRVWILPKWFSQEELQVLDCLTANNAAVLESMGGPPSFPGERPTRPEDMDTEQQQKRADGQQRFGTYHR